MSIIPIRTLGDPVLRQPAGDVESFDRTLRKLADDLLETMYDAPGVGLAATQVGMSLRLFVYDAGDGSGPGAMANPVLSGWAGEQLEDEGCLSIPGLYYPTVRADVVRADGLGLDGEPLTIQGEGLMARILQHETDHLNGMLFIDRLSEDDRRQAMAAMRNLELEGRPVRGGRSGDR